MNLEEFKREVDQAETKVQETRKAYEEAKRERDDFLEFTLGFRSDGVATLLGTVAMIEKILEMKEASK